VPVGDLICIESIARLEVMTIVFEEPAASEMVLETVLLDAGTLMVVFC
jgi:hypothetical protein